MSKANELKEKGNKEFQAGNYQRAADFYSQAIELQPDAVFLSNRAACYLGLKRFSEAVADAQRAVQADPLYPKSYVRGAQALTRLGRLQEAFDLVRRGIETAPSQNDARREYDNLQILMTYKSNFDQHMEAGEYPEALRRLNSLLEKCDHDGALVEKKVEVLCLLGDHKAALAYAREKEAVLRERSPGLPQATLGIVARFSNDLPAARRHLQEAARLDSTLPETTHNMRLIKEMEEVKSQGNELFKKKSFGEAMSFYDRALGLDPLNKHWKATILSNKASCLMAQSKNKEALEMMKVATSLDPDNGKNMYKRGKLEKAVGEWENAETYFKKAKTLDPTLTIDAELKEASKKVRELNKKDYYAIMGVEKNATADEIKKKYKELARKWHPDKHAGNKEEQEKAEKKFKEISEANKVLTDPEKRKRYDVSGADSDGDAFAGYSNMNSFDNPLIQMFFNSGSSNSFNFGGPGGAGGSSGFGGFGGFGARSGAGRGGNSRQQFSSHNLNEDDLFSSFFSQARKR